MPVNFRPNKGQMIKEIEQCVALGKLDVLQCFCNSCAHKFLGESVLVTQCLECRVQQGITRISNRPRWKSSTSPDREFLAGC